MSNIVQEISIKGEICKTVRSIMVQIIRQHNLNNNLNYNLVSNQTPQKDESVGSYRVKVFEISQPRVDNASTTKALTDAKRVMLTDAKVEVFPERLIGALVDLYILYFALTKTKIPERDENYQSVLSGIEETYINEQQEQNDHAFSFLNNKTKENESTDTEEKEKEKGTTTEEKEKEKEKGTTTDEKKFDDYNLSSKMIPYIASAWFCDLLRKKEHTRKLYQEKFQKLEAENKRKLLPTYKDILGYELSNDKREEITDDKLNAKIFVLAQIKHINTSAFDTYKPDNRFFKKRGGIRKTKKNKNSKKRRKNKTTRRKRNTKRNKR